MTIRTNVKRASCEDVSEKVKTYTALYGNP